MVQLVKQCELETLVKNKAFKNFICVDGAVFEKKEDYIVYLGKIQISEKKYVLERIPTAVKCNDRIEYLQPYQMIPEFIKCMYISLFEIQAE